jgi:hypothetical protein
VLGKYSTKVVLPKTKSELVRQINSLGQIEIRVLEPIDKKNIGLAKLEIERFVGNGQREVSIVFIKKK